ncbi:hypothetical protein ACJMK2_021037 [Sinanodonta woodiana]|uniref:Uncharacterized protein n=1 Tax=Sinanodonta woodiana TaxID=1069815 RepID=A0ABD3U3Z1_SINWO
MTTTGFDSDNLTSKTEDKVNASAWASISNDKVINASVQLYSEPVSVTSFPDIDSYANSSLPSSSTSVFNITGQDINITSSNWILSSSRTDISGADVTHSSLELMMPSGISVSIRDGTHENVNTSLISPALLIYNITEEDINTNFVNNTVISGGTTLSNISDQDSYNMSNKSRSISRNASAASPISSRKIDYMKNNHVPSLSTINSTSISDATEFNITSTDSSVLPSGKTKSGVMPGSVEVVHDVNIAKDIVIAIRNASTLDTTAQDVNTMSADSSLTSLPETLIITTGARDTNDSSSELSTRANKNSITFISQVGVSETSFPFGGVSFHDGSFSGIDSVNGLITSKENGNNLLKKKPPLSPSIGIRSIRRVYLLHMLST